MKKDRVKKLLSKKFFDEIEIHRDGALLVTIRGMWGERYFDRQTSDGRTIKTSKPHFLVASDDAAKLIQGDLAVFEEKRGIISSKNDAGTGIFEVELREEYEGDLSGGSPSETDGGSYLDKLKR